MSANHTELDALLGGLQARQQGSTLASTLSVTKKQGTPNPCRSVLVVSSARPEFTPTVDTAVGGVHPPLLPHAHSPSPIVPQVPRHRNGHPLPAVGTGPQTTLQSSILDSGSVDNSEAQGNGVLHPSDPAADHSMARDTRQLHSRPLPDIHTTGGGSLRTRSRWCAPYLSHAWRSPAGAGDVAWRMEADYTGAMLCIDIKHARLQEQRSPLRPTLNSGADGQEVRISASHPRARVSQAPARPMKLDMKDRRTPSATMTGCHTAGLSLADPGSLNPEEGVTWHTTDGKSAPAHGPYFEKAPGDAQDSPPCARTERDSERVVCTSSPDLARMCLPAPQDYQQDHIRLMKLELQDMWTQLYCIAAAPSQRSRSSTPKRAGSDVADGGDADHCSRTNPLFDILAARYCHSPWWTAMLDAFGVRRHSERSTLATVPQIGG
ncbi:hypothetical protein B0H11DRAFT_2276722 [Mycena galericulata]|nr:hypothetical protein B0H11DRAFT_2276722 [Mycena galericulata]